MPMTRTRTIVTLILTMTALPLAACANQSERLGGEPAAAPSLVTPRSTRPPVPAGDGPVNPVPAGYAGRFRVAATVLESPKHGPQLCQFVMTSLPPQCGGPDVVGWSWDAVPHSSEAGTTSGSYVLVGKFDGVRFTLTEPARPSTSADYPPPQVPDYTSPCPTPSGGWRPADPAKTTDATFQKVQLVARVNRGFGGLWINQLPPSGTGGLWVPELTVLNVRFTGNLAKNEAALRKVWGGPLCVTSAKYTEARLTAIQRELNESSSVDVVRGRVDLSVWVADLARQEELDARYGPGLVRLVGAMQPLD